MEGEAMVAGRTNGGRGGQRRPAKILPSDADFGLDPASLVNFVLKARVDLLAERFYDPDQGWQPLPAERKKERRKRGDIAKLVEWDSARFSTFFQRAGEMVTSAATQGSRVDKAGRALTNLAAQQNSNRFKLRTEVGSLEMHLHMFAMRERGATAEALQGFGNLTAFWQELLGSGETSVIFDVQKARWFHDLTESGPQNAAEALVAGDALLSLLSIADGPDAARLLLEEHRSQATRTVRGLMTVATRPPARGTIPAVQILAQLGTLPVDWTTGPPSTVIDLVVEHATFSPVGFRAVPILTRMVTLSTGRFGDPPSWWSADGQPERQAVWDALGVLDDQADHDPYPARSFWVEAMRALQQSGGSIGRSATAAIAKRARNDARPDRERAYAALCLYHATKHADSRELSQILAWFEGGGATGRPSAGLRYAARVIRTLQADTSPDPSLGGLLLGETERVPVESESWRAREEFAGHGDVMAVDLVCFPDRVLDGPKPTTETKEYQKQQRAAEATEALLSSLPHTIRSAFVDLVRYSLLSIDGSGRRRAAEALREAGLGPEAAAVIAQVLRDEQASSWLREHAVFLLGHLVEPSALPALIDVAEEEAEDHASIAVRWAAIWAIGDIAHPSEDAITALIDIVDANPVPLVLRAATYALAMLHPEPTRELASAVLMRLVSLVDSQLPMVADMARLGVVERERAESRRRNRLVDDLWGVAPSIEATLASAGAG